MYKVMACLRLVLVSILAASLLFLSACGSGDKKKELPYLKSTSGLKLKVPDDLKQPEESPLYAIPQLTKAQKQHKIDPEVLEKPPELVERTPEGEEEDD